MANAPSPLRRDTTARGHQEILSLQDLLTSLSQENAQRFTAILDQTLTCLCQNIAEQIAAKLPLQTDETASLYFSRPAYMHLFTTQKHRSRRSASGTYRLYYDLLDADNDGQVDTLRVLSVRHAGAHPFSVENEE